MSDKEHVRDEYNYEHGEKFEEERMYRPAERENPMGSEGMRGKPRGYGMGQRYGEKYSREEYPHEYPRYGGRYHRSDANYGGYMDRNYYYEEPKYHHREHHGNPYYGPRKYEHGPYHQKGYLRDMMGMDGFTGISNWLNRPKVNNFFRGVGLLTVGVILAPTLAKALRPLAVSTVQGAMGMVDDMKGIVDDAKDEVEDIFAEAKWEEEH